MKYFFFLATALLTFLFGCVLTRLVEVKPATSVLVATIPLERRSLLDGIQEFARGCGNGYAQSYLLPDGKMMAEGNTCHRSFAQARREMHGWLKTADRIIDGSVPVALHSDSMSERVVASFPKNEFGDESVKVMWVTERFIHWVSGPTLEHTLEFERSKLNPYKFQ